jgi:hypothetical protein
VTKIIKHAAELVDCERFAILYFDPMLDSQRCSLFLLDRERGELVAKAFDVSADDSTSANKMEIRFPSTMGVAGHVATTGKVRLSFSVL